MASWLDYTLNGLIVEQHKDRSLDEVLRRFEETHAHLVARISTLPADELSKPIRRVLACLMTENSGGDVGVSAASL